MPFVWITLSFTAGVLLDFLYSSSVLWGILSFLCIFLLTLKSSRFFSGVLCAGFLCLGIVSADLDRRPVPTSLVLEIGDRGTQSSLAVIGKVMSDPELKIQGRKQTASFVFRAEKIQRWNGKNGDAYKKAGGLIQVFLNQPAGIPKPGDTLRLWGRLEPLPPVLNPGGFDYQHYLKSRDIDFILNGYGPRSARTLKESAWHHPPRILSNLRGFIRSRIDSLFPGMHGLLIRALILGDRKNLRGALLDDFLKTGTTHLLAISGLNISMVAGSLYLVLIVFRVSQRQAAFWALWTAGLQVAVGGFGIPVQRAGIMAGLGFLALILERERNGVNIFALAFLSLLIWDTRSLESVSFQLSFLSLFCLIIFTYFCKSRGNWLEAFAGSAAVLAGTFPVVLYHFSTFSPSGIIANVLAIPLFHFVLLTAFFSLITGSIPGLGFLLTGLSSLSLKLGLAWIHFCASFDWGYFFLPRPSWIQMIVYYSLLGIFLLSFFVSRLSSRFWKAGILILWSLSAGTFFVPKPQEGFNAVFFSAGSNEIVHLAFSRHNHWLINGGRTFPGDQAKWIVEPYLRSAGVKKLKGIIFTDFKKRHMSGFETLRRNFHFQYQVYPAKQKAEGSRLGKGILLKGGDFIRMPEGGSIRILGHIREALTFQVCAEGKTILFLPDISFSVFQQLYQAKDVRSDILVLPSVRGLDKKILKSLLTLTRAKIVITPKIPEDSAGLLEENEREVFDLSAQGALQLRIEKGSDGNLLKLIPFKAG